MTTEQEQIAREIFNMIYIWGRLGVVANYQSPIFQSEVGKLLGNKSNGQHLVRERIMECWDKNCELEHNWYFTI